MGGVRWERRRRGRSWLRSEGRVGSTAMGSVVYGLDALDVLIRAWHHASTTSKSRSFVLPSSVTSAHCSFILSVHSQSLPCLPITL